MTMPHPTPHPFETWRIDLALCAGEFRRGLISEAGFRHHLKRLGYLPHEIEAEVEHHRTDEVVLPLLVGEAA
jgi:hypothetical protein